MTVAMRPELEPLPSRMQMLPVDARGYPVPWFVAWIDGKPEFRAMDIQKFARAVRERRCWVCGDILGRHLTFTVGPMCGVNRISAEPPSHDECARWSVRNCPFLSRPHAVRRDPSDIGDYTKPGGVMIERNPGVTLLWETRSYSIVRTDRTPLIEMGPPDRVTFWCEGRIATRSEIDASVETGLPLLRTAAEQEETALRRAEAIRALDDGYARFQQLLPPAWPSPPSEGMIVRDVV